MNLEPMAVDVCYLVESGPTKEPIGTRATKAADAYTAMGTPEARIASGWLQDFIRVCADRHSTLHGVPGTWVTIEDEQKVVNHGDVVDHLDHKGNRRILQLDPPEIDARTSQVISLIDRWAGVLVGVADQARAATRSRHPR